VLPYCRTNWKFARHRQQNSCLQCEPRGILSAICFHQGEERSPYKSCDRIPCSFDMNFAFRALFRGLADDQERLINLICSHMSGSFINGSARHPRMPWPLMCKAGLLEATRTGHYWRFMACLMDLARVTSWVCAGLKIRLGGLNCPPGKYSIIPSTVHRYR
jgi:hypothetical protein